MKPRDSRPFLLRPNTKREKWFVPVAFLVASLVYVSASAFLILYSLWLFLYG